MGGLTNGPCAHTPRPAPRLGKARAGGLTNVAPRPAPRLGEARAGGLTNVAPRPAPRLGEAVEPVQTRNLVRACVLRSPASWCPSCWSLPLCWSRPRLPGGHRLVSGTVSGGAPFPALGPFPLCRGWPQGSTHGWPPAGPACGFLNPASVWSLLSPLSSPRTHPPWAWPAGGLP